MIKTRIGTPPHTTRWCCRDRMYYISCMTSHTPSPWPKTAVRSRNPKQQPGFHLFRAWLCLGICLLLGTATDKDSSYRFYLEMEKEIFRLTNAEREKRNLLPFKPHPMVKKIARLHSANMVIHNFYSHTDHRGWGPSRRKQAHFPHILGAVGENIARTSGLSATGLAKRLVGMWMRSPGHRRNILHEKYNYLGVGVAGKGDGYWATQNFALLIAEPAVPVPKSIPYGTEYKFLFKYLGHFKKSRLTVIVHFADKSARYPAGGGAFYTGLGKPKVEWDKEYFSFTLKCDKGRGVYRITMGRDGSYYPAGLEFKVQ